MKATDFNATFNMDTDPVMNAIVTALGGDVPNDGSLPPVGVDLHIAEIIPADFQPTDEKNNPVGDRKPYVKVCFKEGGSLSFKPLARAAGVKFTGLNTNKERVKAMLTTGKTFKFYSKVTAVGKRGEYSVYTVSEVDFGASEDPKGKKA